MAGVPKGMPVKEVRCCDRNVVMFLRRVAAVAQGVGVSSASA